MVYYHSIIPELKYKHRGIETFDVKNIRKSLCKKFAKSILVQDQKI